VYVRTFFALHGCKTGRFLMMLLSTCSGTSSCADILRFTTTIKWSSSTKLRKADTNLTGKLCAALRCACPVLCSPRRSCLFCSPNWDGISADAKNLISQLLVLDPRRRLSVEQALKHPWIVGEKVPSNDLDVALGKLRSFKQRRGFTIKQGTIRKRGGIIPRWQDRCFVLTPETLSYYVSEHSQTVRVIVVTIELIVDVVDML